MWFHLNEVPRVVKMTATEIRMVVAKGWGTGSYYLMRTEFQLGKTKTSWRWMLVMTAQKDEYLMPENRALKNG